MYGNKHGIHGTTHGIVWNKKMAHKTLKFDKYKKAGGKGIYDRGVLSITLDEWDEFYHEIRRFRGYRDYVWRGQRCGYPEWELKARFDRSHKYKNEDERESVLDKHYDAFRKAVRGRRGPNPPELKENDLWAIGQHNSLSTPLLDWTESPFVAAYFAFVEEAERSDDKLSKRVVYALNRDIKRWYRRVSGSSEKEYFIEFPEIEAHENIRFLAQAGVFTKALKGQDVKRRVQKSYNENNHRNRIGLAEIMIPESQRIKCLMDLNQMNINHASLFPDIYGSAIFCNLKLEIDK